MTRATALFSPLWFMLAELLMLVFKPMAATFMNPTGHARDSLVLGFNGRTLTLPVLERLGAYRNDDRHGAPSWSYFHSTDLVAWNSVGICTSKMGTSSDWDRSPLVTLTEQNQLQSIREKAWVFLVLAILTQPPSPGREWGKSASPSISRGCWHWRHAGSVPGARFSFRESPAKHDSGRAGADREPRPWVRSWEGLESPLHGSVEPGGRWLRRPAGQRGAWGSRA